VNQPSAVGDHSWRFLTNHAHVLERIASDPTVRLRDISASVGITERAAASIVNDLVEAGYLTRSRIGRRNNYDVHDERPLRHPLHRHHTVGELIRFLEAPAPEPVVASRAGHTRTT
jgi:DNA-binding transcriptional regulator PaaX